MIGSDAQKTFTLQYKKGLIDSGYFERTRNPNYLGEVMIYGSFALASGFLWSWVIMLFFWLVLFLGNMLNKDYNSLMKKAGWPKY
jgi:protein-S-isoprenylcysteine O-methyltransferase Ste14